MVDYLSDPPAQALFFPEQQLGLPVHWLVRDRNTTCRVRLPYSPTFAAALSVNSEPRRM